jgi:hypothetical protein
MRSMISCLALTGWLGLVGCSHPPEPQAVPHALPLDAVNTSTSIGPPDLMPDGSLAPDGGLRGDAGAIAPDATVPVL